jgi:hypothetical protein
MTNNTVTARIARYIALPVVSAGIIAGAALGMAGMANAAARTEPTGPGYTAGPGYAAGPGYDYAPTVTAQPAPEALPGWQGHHGPAKIANLVPGYVR